MTLEDTIPLMTSGDYKERFKAEYFQLKIRYRKLKAILDKHETGRLRFKLDSPLIDLKSQLYHMKKYLEILEGRAGCEDVDLEE